ncbi:uncharacterized protein [Nicotiana tomentosiformis]|uniref:uncharacterized protein n=1 Tax=Nicotiana tomentosiformis TaxID=4098 RepID=UPI00388CBABD
MNLDLACGGSCMSRPYSEIQILLNNFTANDNNWQEDGKPRRALKQKAADVIELDDFSAMRKISPQANYNQPSKPPQQAEECLTGMMKKLLLDNQNVMAENQQLRETEKTPQVNAVTLRNGRELVEVPKKKKEKSGLEEERVPKPVEVNGRNKTKSEQISKRLPPPFPQRLRKKNHDHMFHKFLDMLKQILLNIPLVDMIRECTSRIQHKLPQKLKDLGSFTIPVMIGEIDMGRALCDLGASINLMPFSVLKQLGLGAPRPTTMMLQLADRSYVYPEGVIEDVLLQIGMFIFPVDFIILDHESDKLVPIILRRPLLATRDAIINVREGKMIMRVENEEAVFNVYRAIQLPRHYEDLAMISVVEINEPAVEPSAFKEDVLENVLMLSSHLELEEEEEKLLRVLREHKHAIGWTMSDIKGISPAFCMHKILMEEGHKPSVEHQCRLNPIMKEVVRKEVIKWLDADCYCPGRSRKDHFYMPLWTYAIKRMLFGLCNAPSTFQRCMMAIFTDMVEWFVEVFMEDFSVFGYSFDECLTNLAKVLARCEETNLVLNWEKCHFMVREGIVMGHKVSKDGLEVDKAKVEAIEKLPPPISVKGVTSFLGHTGFYRRFIKDFSKISSPLCSLLEKDVSFKFDDSCLKSLEELKKKLVSAPIIVALTGMGHLSRCVTLVMEFDLEIRDRKGTENQVADHLSRLETRNHVAEGDVIKETFPDEQLLANTTREVPWYVDFVNYLASGKMFHDLEPYAIKKYLRDVRSYVWDEPFLFKSCTDQLMRRCVPKSKINVILYSRHASPYNGHHAGDKTEAKVLQSGFYCPKVFKNAHEFVRGYDRFQRTGTIMKRHEMPLHGIMEVEIFESWGIDFMGLFSSSSGCKYILVVVGYVSKWVKAIALPTNDAKVVVNFMKKNIFTMFGTPRMIINDGGTYFCNKLLDNVLAKYGVKHKVATAYHPQTSGQVEVSDI